MAAVVGMITALVVMLSGLTEGLGRQSTSAITTLSADHIAFAPAAAGESLSMNAGQVSAQQVQKAADQKGVKSAAPLGISTSRVNWNGTVVQSAVFGIDPGATGAPSKLAAGTAVVSSQFGSKGDVKTGDVVSIDGKKLRVAEVVDDASFSHLPVVWVPRDVWQSTAGPSADAGSVILLDTDDAFEAAAFDKGSGLTAKTRSDSLSTIGSYSAENGSLMMIRALLIAISALVIGAFFTVWTVQREPDLAVLKAVGARTSYLVGDALGQALIILVIGGLAGTGLALFGEWLAAGAVPVVITASTVLTPLILILIVGLIGAAAALRRVVTVDPLDALAGVR